MSPSIMMSKCLLALVAVALAGFGGAALICSAADGAQLAEYFKQTEQSVYFKRQLEEFERGFKVIDKLLANLEAEANRRSESLSLEQKFAAIEGSLATKVCRFGRTVKADKYALKVGPYVRRLQNYAKSCDNLSRNRLAEIYRLTNQIAVPKFERVGKFVAEALEVHLAHCKAQQQQQQQQ